MTIQLYNFEKLKVYHLGEQLVSDVYQLLKTFPNEEIYGLTAQIKRSIISVPLNIAEGATSRSAKDFIRFIHIAVGSLTETKSALKIAVKLNFLEQEKFEKLLPQFDSLYFMLMALKKSLYEKK